MGPFVIIGTTLAAPRQASQSPTATVLRRPDWISQDLSETVRLHRSARAPLSTLRRGDGRVYLIGDVFPTESTRSVVDGLEATTGRAGVDAARAIQAAIWGRYILVQLDPKGAVAGLYRDPSGALECRHWRHGDGVIAASDPSPVVERLPPKDLAIDWSSIAAQLGDPAGFAKGSSLRGVSAVAPGAYYDAVKAVDHQLWRPADWACRPRLNPEDAAEVLRRAIDRAVDRLAGGRRVAAEVSGGLDSSIVACALHASRAVCVGWFHRAPSEVTANERPYAQALAAHLGVDLDISPLPDLAFDLDDIALNQDDVTPSVSSLDLPGERSAIDLCARAGAESLFTGMAGDAVFWTAATPLVLSDRLARVGWAAVFDPVSIAVARWNRTPLWKVVVGAWWANRRPIPAIYHPPPWLTVDTPPYRHPWLEGSEALPAGKRLQIKALSLMHAAMGASQRRRALDLVHPLLSQPVLEACLAIPLDILTLGGRDRGLARYAYRDDLPAPVLNRRSKGDISERIAKSLADGLPVVRKLLLQGRLVETGLIDAERLDTALSEDALAQGADILAIYRAAAIELWVRRWEAVLSIGPGGA